VISSAFKGAAEPQKLVHPARLAMVAQRRTGVRTEANGDRAWSNRRARLAVKRVFFMGNQSATAAIGSIWRSFDEDKSDWSGEP
jgi:hypothetical protein